jgi:2,4-dienoyl-CoA reductase-like NADH-dependent reductase (Old Yellow Enzyme family)/thioredoxin reductase
MSDLSHLQEPISIGPIELRNRLMMTVHGPRLPQRRYVRYLEERVRGGVALVGLSAAVGLYDLPLGPGRYHASYAGDIDVVPPHPLSAEGIAHFDRFITVLREQADAIHRHGGKCVGQVYHPGANQNANVATDTFQPAIAPSAVPDEYRRNVPHVLTTGEIADVVETYAQAGRRIAEAGIDAIEIHGAHGYLVNQFMSPYTNKRTDEYGGSLDNRMRFVAEIIAATRHHVGDYPIGIRINGSDRVEGGLTNDDMQEIARRLAALGMIYVNISGGTYGGMRHGLKLPYVSPSYMPEGHNVDDAAGIKAAVDIPVIVAGRLVDMEMAERIVAEGKADIVGMTRAFMADPAIINKSFAGGSERERVIPCIGCNECHYGRMVTCAVNAATGREEELKLEPATTARRVVIVGGGVGGMECARVAALRGHNVILCERGDELGGVISVLGRDEPRSDFKRYLQWLRQELQQLPVDIRLDTDASVDLLRSLAPDVVVLATGATDHRPDVPGVDSANVFTATELFAGRAALGQHVVVVGGLDDHLPVLTTADLASRGGATVTLLTETLHAGQDVEVASLLLLTKRLLEQGVVTQPLTALAAIDGSTVRTRNTVTNAPGQVDGVDTVIVVAERRPADGLAAGLRAAGHEVHLIGDALAPRRMMHANLEGVRLAQLL